MPARRLALLRDAGRIRDLALVQASLRRGARSYLERQGFVDFTSDMPHLTGLTGACENLSTVFEVYGVPTSHTILLAQTCQLYLETLIPSLDRVWCEGPSFRAEPRVDSRHLLEFWLIEIEFLGGFDELLARLTDLVIAMLDEVTRIAADSLERLGSDPRRLEQVRRPFLRFSYTDAIKELGLPDNSDLGAAEEADLVRRAGGVPLFVTHFPKQLKFFNMRENAEYPHLVNSADLLLPFSGESAGAAEREYEYDAVAERLVNSAMWNQLPKDRQSLDQFDWYLNHLRSASMRPHAGGGLGLNRITQFVLESNDIRDATLFPVAADHIL